MIYEVLRRKSDKEIIRAMSEPCCHCDDYSEVAMAGTYTSKRKAIKRANHFRNSFVRTVKRISHGLDIEVIYEKRD